MGRAGDDGGGEGGGQPGDCGGEGGGGGDGDGGEGIKKIALLEPSASAVRVPKQLLSSMTTEPPAWSNTVWKTSPVPESGISVAVVVMVPKQMFSPGGKTISLGNLSSPQRLSSGHEKGELGSGKPRVYATFGVSADGVKCTNLKALGHWPPSQVDPLPLTGLQAMTTSNMVPALRTAETPLNST